MRGETPLSLCLSLSPDSLLVLVDLDEAVAAAAAFLGLLAA